MISKEEFEDIVYEQFGGDVGRVNFTGLYARVFSSQIAERDRAAVLVEALEFYGKGHDHNHEMYQKIDCDKIPALKVVNLQKEISLGRSAKQICDEALQPSFELLSGKIARQALAKHKKGTE